jgi:hypothetical protein
MLHDKSKKTIIDSGITKQKDIKGNDDICFALLVDQHA